MARPRRRRPLPYGPQFGVDADGKPVIRPNPNDPIAKATGKVPGVIGPREVLRRQRLLKANGYKIVVDGRWGPLSRRYWKNYLASRSIVVKRGPQPKAVKPGVPPMLSPGLAARDRIEKRQADRAASRAQRIEIARIAKENAQIRARSAKLALKGGLMAELGVGIAGLPTPKARPLPRPEKTAITRAIEPRDPGERFAQSLDPKRRVGWEQAQRTLRENRRLAAKAWSKPTEKWTTHDVWLLAANEDTAKLDLGNPQHVRRIQHWLGTKGHRVRLTGTYDSATRDAFLALAQEEQQAQARKTATSFVTATFKAGIFKPGTPGLPVFGGKFPDQAGLIKLLSDGSFSSHLLFTKLWQQALQPDARYLLWADQLITGIEKDVLGPWQPPAWLAVKGETLAERAARLVGLASGFGAVERPDARNDTFVPTLLALTGSRNASQFQRELKKIAAKDEADYKVAQAIRAMESGGDFWGKAFDALAYPSEKTFEVGTAVALAFQHGRQSLSGPRSGNEVDPVAEAQMYREWLEENHPWIHLGATLIVDPLNLAPGLGAIRAGGRAGTEALHSVGLALSRKGELVAEASLYGLRSHALKGVGAALRAPSVVTTGIGLEARAMRSALDENVGPLGKVWRTGTRLKRLKDETHQIALHKARTVLRHGFRKPKAEPLSLAGTDLYTNVDWYEFDGDFGKRLDESADTMRFYLKKHAPVLMDALVRDRISFAGVDSREVESMVGGMVVGRLGAEAQQTAIEMVAREARAQTFQRLAAQYDALSDADLRALAQEVGVRTSDERAALITRIAARNAEADFDRVLQEAAFYAAGGSDSAIASRVDNIASRALDRLITILHADVQTLLEEAADGAVERAVAAGMDEAEARKLHGLFDENGRHTSKGSPVEEWLRGRARGVFDDTVVVVNRRFGRAYTREERDQLIDLEVRQRVRQLNYWKARRGVDGKGVEDGQFDRLLEEHVEKVEARWLKVTSTLDPEGRLAKRWMQAAGATELPPVGTWIDTRAMVEVPRVYARHLTSAHLPDGGIWNVEEAAARREAARQSGSVPRTEADGTIPAVGRRKQNAIPLALNRTNVDDVIVGRPGEHGAALLRRAGAGPFSPSADLVRGLARLDRDGNVTAIDFLTWDKGGNRWEINRRPPKRWQDAARDALLRSFSADAGNRSVLGALTDVDASTFARVEDEIQRLVAASMETPPLSDFDFEARPFARGFRSSDEPLVGEPLAGDGIDEIVDYRNALISRAEHLQAAYDAVLPKVLLREAGVWQAMAEARNGWLKVLYTGMQAWLDVWTTLTLPFRPGFAVRNVVDNTVKMLVAGVRDPRMFFLGGEKPGSVFDVDLRAIRWVLTVGHRYDQNPALRYFDQIVQEVWELGSDVLGKVFQAHGVPIPPEAIEGMRVSQVIDTPAVKRYQLVAKGDDLRTPGSVMWGYWKDRVWELAADRPESYAKRVVYRDTYYKAVERGADPVDAFHEAMSKIDHTLFDYSKLSTLEHNLKFIFPFAYYWRKTAKFWGTEAITKPWLPASFSMFEQARDEAHENDPEWMRRYFDTSWVNDVVGAIPGLEWAAPGISDFTTQTDPANFLSFTPLYRTFKSENPGLPPDKAGLKWIGSMADAINDVGLSFNPIVRKPLEMTGVFNFRAWQTMLPQTALVQGFTREHLHEMFPNGLNVEEMLLDPIFKETLGISSSEMNEQRMNELVQKEMAAQLARGEKVSRARARKKVERFEYAKTVVAYFAGVYTRNNDPGEHALYVIADQLRKEEIDFLSLPKEMQMAYSLFKRRGWDARRFDRYQQTLPTIQAYYAIGDWQQSERFKEQHPEIIQYVAPGATSKPIVAKGSIRYVALQADTAAAVQMFRWAKGARLNRDLVERARKTLVTPALEAYWKRNDTPAKTRDLMLRGEFWRYVRHVQDGYFTIPDSDFASRDQYLADNPVLSAAWGFDNTPYDDVSQVEGQFLADLREAYFEHVDREDWTSAEAFLKQHPFAFDGTSAEGRVWNGMLLPDDPRKAADFKRAYPALQRYFALRRQSKQAAFRWLKSGDKLAKLALAYFAKYPSGNRSQHAKDYLKVKALLDWFFKLAEEGAFRGYYSRWEWVFKSDDPVAKQLRWYFQKYGKKGGRSQKARDYLKAKKHLDHYFALVNAGKKDEAREWLNGGSAGARIVLAYFKKYSKVNRFQRMYAKRVRSQNAELDRRLKFWSIYFSLPDDKRPGFVHREAERYGVFVYGVFGDEQRADAEAKYLRWAKGTRMSKKAAAYLRVKPMLDFYFKLDGSDRLIFKRLNPEVGDYLTKYADTDFTKDKKLNKLIAQYVRLPEMSPERSEFLRAHPEVQDYFDESRPTDRAIRNLLEVYFDIEDPDLRSDFAMQHPEISAYFEQRRAERTALSAELAQFDETDPRLAELRDDAYATILLPGEAKRKQLRLQVANGLSPDAIESRRARRPLEE